MISNRITKMIVSLLLNLLLFCIVAGAATTTYSGVATTYGGVTSTYSVVTATYSGVTSAANNSSQNPGERIKGADENVTIAVQTMIPIATVSEKAAETAKVPSNPAEKASGFEVVFTVITICTISIFKLKRR